MIWCEKEKRKKTREYILHYSTSTFPFLTWSDSVQTYRNNKTSFETCRFAFWYVLITLSKASNISSRVILVDVYDDDRRFEDSVFLLLLLPLVAVAVSLLSLFVVIISKSVIIKSNAQSPRKIIEKHDPGSRSVAAVAVVIMADVDDDTDDRLPNILPRLPVSAATK